MRYRAMFYTLVTVALALLTITLWLVVMEKLVHRAVITDTTGTTPEAEHLRLLLRGTLILALVLVSALLLLGFAATWREWNQPRAGRMKATRYVDAWKIAGERMSADEAGEEESS